MKMFLSLIVLLVLGMSSGLAQSPPCPPPNVDVESQCLPAPPWVSKLEVIELSPGCWAEIEYCVQWVCVGHAGLSRSRISISRIRVWSETDLPPLCPWATAPDPLDPNFLADYDAYMQALFHELIIQGIVLNDGPLKPCSPTNTDYMTEVMMTPCVMAGAWGGKVRYNDPLSPGGAVWKDVTGFTLSFCSGEGGCLVKYHTCLDNGVPVTTEVDREVFSPTTCTGAYTGYPNDDSFNYGRLVSGDVAVTNPGLTVDIWNDWWEGLGESCIVTCHE